MLNEKNSVIDYFEGKAKSYDLVDSQLYWVLSDKLLWQFIQQNILVNLREDFMFLDAGAGTARWTEKIMKNNPSSKGTLVDISIDMLNVAIEKLKRNGYDKRVKIYNRDLSNLSFIEDETFDFVFNLHNVLGFVENPNQVISELNRVTKKGGYILSVIPNLYHNLYFSLQNNNLSLIENAKEKKISKFTQDMPYMNFFTPKSIEKMYIDNNINPVIISGFPNFIYPGFEETQIEGNNKKLYNILENKNIFDMIFNLENEFFYKADIAARGNQIFALGIKNI